MKKKKEHVVPLSNRALEIVRHLRPRKGVLVFSGPDGEKMSDALMLAVIRRMDNRSLKSEGPGWRDLKGKRVVPHGFRSTFRDWAGECTSNPREVIENALAHLLKDKSEAAYARGTQLEKRKALMDSWMQYCAQLPKGKARKPRQNQ
jgi:integrase